MPLVLMTTMQCMGFRALVTLGTQNTRLTKVYINLVFISHIYIKSVLHKECPIKKLVFQKVGKLLARLAPSNKR